MLQSQTKPEGHALASPILDMQESLGAKKRGRQLTHSPATGVLLKQPCVYPAAQPLHSERASRLSAIPAARLEDQTGLRAGAHPGLAPEAAEGGGVDGGHRAVHIGVVDSRDGVALGARNEVILDDADAAHIPHVAVLRRLQRHVLGAHLRSA